MEVVCCAMKIFPLHWMGFSACGLVNCRIYKYIKINKKRRSLN